MYKHLLALGDTRIDELAERVQILKDFRIVIPGDMDIFRFGWGCLIPTLRGFLGSCGLVGRCIAPRAHHRITTRAGVGERVGDFLGHIHDHIKLRRFLGCRLQIQIHSRVIDTDRPIGVAPFISVVRLSRVQMIILFLEVMQNPTSARTFIRHRLQGRKATFRRTSGTMMGHRSR